MYKHTITAIQRIKSSQHHFFFILSLLRVSAAFKTCTAACWNNRLHDDIFTTWVARRSFKAVFCIPNGSRNHGWEFPLKAADLIGAAASAPEILPQSLFSSGRKRVWLPQCVSHGWRIRAAAWTVLKLMLLFLPVLLIITVVYYIAAPHLPINENESPALLQEETKISVAEIDLLGLEKHKACCC